MSASPAADGAGDGRRPSGLAPDGRRLRIAVSNNVLPPDPARVFYPPSALLYVEEQMAGWVSSTGALAYAVPRPVRQSGAGLAEYVADLDGLVLTGGADVAPGSYGEEPVEGGRWPGDEARDRYEIELARRFVEAGKPVLGICRGHQVLNVAFGGTLYQDLNVQGATERIHRSQDDYHRNLHEVDLVAGGWLAGLYPGVERARVNTIHHQGVKDVAPGMVVEAVASDDGVVEAIRLEDGHAWVAGVQWHPEFFALVPEEGLLDQRPILDAFLTAAAAVLGR